MNIILFITSILIKFEIQVLLDDIFSMFNNLNCPNLAGKPKLFFIQSCRDGGFLLLNKIVWEENFKHDATLFKIQ